MIAGNQVEWRFLVPVLLGSIPAARVGAKLSHALPSPVLRRMLLALVFLSLLQSLYKLLA